MKIKIRKIFYQIFKKSLLKIKRKNVKSHNHFIKNISQIQVLRCDRSCNLALINGEIYFPIYSFNFHLTNVFSLRFNMPK